METVVSAPIATMARAVGPGRDEVLEAMDEQARREEFPTVGPEVGGWLTVLAGLADARRVFEFGSGFGYSAYWFARGLPEDGKVVLTEVDADELDQAREYFRQGGMAGKARFEHGDAIEVVADCDGPFDVVLIDNEKDRYVAAFEAVRPKLRPGSVVLADNALAAHHVDHEEVLELLDGADPAGAREGSRGIAAYLEHVRDRPDFETVLLPLGEGVAVSVRR